ncbi:YihY/virulence factor BrkB family protein [Rhodohalobacter sp. SW132]|uniref:YihY/virulence factor BrkB family protein n=1 Tax=Rhodohalobacter sp. SW132 TaxID=2293433 RepID=UPI000E24A9F6|nr:YihY/virulence factor BrkB family protein [Rhodohalobacter sp. SW132]REL38161.1 YihY/virulence factor BrkB family protein [Rhodohalobacter sp. SW132]
MILKKENVLQFWSLLKDSYKEFNENDPLRLSSSTAFFATFSIIPIIILLLTLFGIIFSEQLLTGEFLNALQGMVGEETTEHLSTVLENIQQMQQGIWLTVGIIIFLMFVATTLFIVVQSSFNQIWKVQPKEDVTYRFIVKNRGISLLIILVTGLLFLTTLFLDLLIGFLGDNILNLIPGINQWLIKLLYIALSLVIFTLWFASMFKFLPDVKLTWKNVWPGSLLTAILFLIGQHIMGLVLVSGNISTIYGASGSLVLLLLFIFYSSFILYFGATFVKNYAVYKDEKIKTTKFAVRYEINIVE